MKIILEPVTVAQGREYADGKNWNYMSALGVAAYPVLVCPEIRGAWFPYRKLKVWLPGKGKGDSGKARTPEVP